MLCRANLAQHVVPHVGVELGERVVEQQDGRGAGGLGDGQDLRHAQRQRQQALLPPRAERPRVHAVELDGEVVAMRAHQRHAAPQLVRAQPLDRRQQRRGLRRLADRGAVRDLDLGALAGQRPGPGQQRIDPAHLGVKRGHRAPAPIDQLDARRRQLLVPRRQPRHRPARLQQPVATGHDLAIAEQRGQMAREQPGRAAVDEVAARGGRAVEDGQVLPAERDHARPRARLAGGLPAAVGQPLDRAPDRARAFGSQQLATEHRRLAAPVRNVAEPRGAERAPRQQDGERLQEVRLALRIEAGEEVELRSRAIGEGTIITEFQYLQASNLHP